MLSLYDTVLRRKIPFVPLESGRARLYTCGPTVYRYAHLGNLRTFLLTDLLVRSLRFFGYSTRAVQNITDVGHMHQEDLSRLEDRVVSAAREAGMSAREIASFFAEAFFRDCRRMGFLPADAYPLASEHVPDMIALVAALERRGLVYEKEGYLYFDVAGAAGYGELSGVRLGEGAPAERTDPKVHRHKKRPEDFALWLPAGPEREFRWESPWGPGWPGWHVECAAMAVRYLGPGFDIHAGGIDLRFPHHENERAMAMAATGGRFASLWMHAAHLVVNGRKMSKSAGNEYRLDEIAAAGFDPMDFRYYCLTVHYRTPMNFTWEGQAAAATGRARLRDALADRGAAGESPAGAAEAFRREFRKAIGDDLNAPRAIAVLHEAVRAGLPGGTLRALASEWDAVLGVGLIEASAREAPAAPKAAEAAPETPPEVIDLAARRESLRRERRFAEADALRARIRDAGYEVVDTREGGVRLRKL